MSIFVSITARALMTALLVIAVSGCGINSQVTHSFVDPEFRELDLHGVMVVAVVNEPSVRTEFEDTFARALTRRGVHAVASHTLLPQKKPTAEEVVAAAEKAGLDTLLVTRYVGEKTEEVYHPGAVYYAVTPVFDPGYGTFSGYYGRATEVAYQQPVWTANVSHTLISDLYVAKTRKRLWQATSDTIQASGRSQVLDDSIDALIGNLKEKGLLE
tara:strand:- start:31051 stop:31692 length:642 start_codon:yes stop_codon:yes gene_type:complete